jgi:hypothetical protein
MEVAHAIFGAFCVHAHQLGMLHSDIITSVGLVKTQPMMSLMQWIGRANVLFLIVRGLPEVWVLGNLWTKDMRLALGKDSASLYDL